MVSVGNRAASKVFQLLTSSTGLNASVAALAQSETAILPPISAKQIFRDNVSVELAERSGEARYTGLYIYCEKITNDLKEKFRSFSGKIQLAIEVRVTCDRLEGLDQQLQLYAESVAQVLNNNRGDWGQGLYYTGGYEALFGAVKHGGRNFLKIAKVTFEVNASVN